MNILRILNGRLLYEFSEDEMIAAEQILLNNYSFTKILRN
jgi:hypothetical protein